MNLGAARTELLARGFSYLDSTRANLMLNTAKNELEDEHDWPWLETTTTGVAPLTIADLKRILYVVDLTNGRQLTGLDAQDIADRDVVVTTAGSPDSWYLDGLTTLRLYPTSTSDQLSVRYVKYSPELVADGDTPQIPVRYHVLWVDYACVEAYRDVENYAAANALLQHIKQVKLPQLLSVFGMRNMQNPEYTQVTFASEDW